MAHNALLDVGAELGMVAMCLLAAVPAAGLRAPDRARSQRGYGDRASSAPYASRSTIASSSAMFLSEQYFLPFWLIGGLAAAIWVDGQDGAKPQAGAA